MKSNIIFILVLFYFFSGCLNRRYLDQPTPSSSVPPYGQQEPPQIIEIERSSSDETNGLYAKKGDNYILDEVMTRDSQQHDFQNGLTRATCRSFAKRYSEKGAPRMAIFLNRTLSDDVSDWKTHSKIKALGKGSITSKNEKGPKNESFTVDGPITIYSQEEKALTGKRCGPADGPMWSYENAFIAPFLRAGTNLVDRATIMRQTALDSRQKNQKSSEISKNTIEISALKDKADIFIEILISSRPSALYGYELRAMAKDLRTGRILGSATNLNWDKNKFKKKKIELTSAGYEIVGEEPPQELKEASEYLALDLMNSIMNTWEINERK